MSPTVTRWGGGRGAATTGGALRAVAAAGLWVGVRRQAPRLDAADLEQDGTDAHPAPDPAQLLPRFQSLDRGVRPEPHLAQVGVAPRTAERPYARAAMQRHLARLAVVMLGRAPVADEPQGEALRVADQRVVVQGLHVRGDRLGDGLPPGGVQPRRDQWLSTLPDAQPAALVIVAHGKPRQP